MKELHTPRVTPLSLSLKHAVTILLSAALIALTGCSSIQGTLDSSYLQPESNVTSSDDSTSIATATAVEDFQTLSDRPDFGELEGFAGKLEVYGELDALGRCTPALVCLGLETVPTEGRGQIGSVLPTGYHAVQYDCVPGNWLYNRCHMVAFQLAGQNDNIQNLITGTRRMNVVMQGFENAIRSYIVGTGNHVMYRVSPDFIGDELVARGVRLEALSVEDDGAGISYDVYIPNVQDGVIIDYATGDSWLEEGSESSIAISEPPYVLNTSKHKFHRPECHSVKTISVKNREDSNLNRLSLIEQGYEPCGSCRP